MKIFINAITGNIRVLDIKGTDTLLDVKMKIQILEGIPSKDQRLIFDGKRITGYEAISYYNIVEFSTIHLI